MRWVLILLFSVSILFGQNSINNYHKQKISKLEKIFADQQRQLEFGVTTLENLVKWHSKLFQAKYASVTDMEKKLAFHREELDFYNSLYTMVKSNKDSFQVADILIIDLAIFEAYTAYEKTYNNYSNTSSKKQPKYENISLKMQKLIKSLSTQ